MGRSLFFGVKPLCTNTLFHWTRYGSIRVVVLVGLFHFDNCLLKFSFQSNDFARRRTNRRVLRFISTVFAVESVKPK